MLEPRRLAAGIATPSQRADRDAHTPGESKTATDRIESDNPSGHPTSPDPSKDRRCPAGVVRSRARRLARTMQKTDPTPPTHAHPEFAASASGCHFRRSG